MHIYTIGMGCFQAKGVQVKAVLAFLSISNAFFGLS